MIDTERNSIRKKISVWEKFKKTRIKPVLKSKGKYVMERDPQFMRLDPDTQAHFKIFKKYFKKGMTVEKFCREIGNKKV